MYLDHIVHFTGRQPAEAVEFWRRRGFHTAMGGEHEKWGTHNALLYLKDCYIEWLAVGNPEVAEDANHPLIRQLLYDGMGLATICLRTEAIEELNGRLLEDGFRTSGILDAERRNAEGALIKWKMLFIEEEISDGLPFPFFIEWQESDEQRYENLRNDGVILPANEKMEIERCVFGVYSIEESEKKWRELLGGELELANGRIEFIETEEKKERLEIVVFRQGEQKIEFEGGVYFVPVLL